MNKISLLSPLLSFALLAPTLAAGNVLRVGSGQTYATVQAAINAASNGDLILVDPGTYAAFEVNAKAISIAASNGSFTVQTASGVSAILVHDIASGQVVSILGATVSYSEPTVPAVCVYDNAGAVRFSRLVVSEDGDLTNAATRTAFLVENTATFWLIDSQVWTATPRSGNTTNPLGSNDGISGLEMLDSDGVLQNVKLHGYDNSSQHAGDGLRVRDDSHVWLRDDVYGSPTAAKFTGGEGGAYGGHAVHLLGTSPNQNQITMCQGVDLNKGSGSTQNGGYYSINNDDGKVPCGGNQCWRLPTVCSGDQLAENTLLSDTVQPGGYITVRTWTATGRDYQTVMSFTTVYTQTLSGFYGHPMINLGVSYTTVVSGTSSGGVAVVTNVLVPNSASLIGLQITFQTATGPVGSAFDVLSAPSLCVVTP